MPPTPLLFTLLRKQLDQQHRSDIAAVTLQVAIHVIEDWLQRISSDKHPQLPDEMGILPADFSLAKQRANSIDDAERILRNRDSDRQKAGRIRYQ